MRQDKVKKLNSREAKNLLLQLSAQIYAFFGGAYMFVDSW